MRLLDFCGIPNHGGSLELLVAYCPEPAVAAAAAGRPICLAVHVGSHDTGAVLWDAPRSRPVRLTEGHAEVVAPLVLPPAPGRYHLEVDAVVEGAFWASGLGVVVTAFEAVRSEDSSVVLTDLATGVVHRVPVLERFAVPATGYGRAASERCIEVPWALMHYRGEERVLDVGFANAELAHVEALGALGAPLLAGLDLVAASQPGIAGVQADVRMPPFSPASFDLIFAISVIEHIGRDNSVYVWGRGGEADAADGDLEAVRQLAALLRPGGRLVITVPFGHGENHGWLVQYDTERLERLVRASGLSLAGAEFYYYDGSWKGPVPAGRLSGYRYRVGDHSASALACVVLQQPVAVAPSRLRRVLAALGVGRVVATAVGALATLRRARALAGDVDWLWRRPVCS